MKSTSADITRKDFKEAILRLYKTTPFKDITVRKLCETAGYNRSTFYLHYKDIIDLLHEIDDDLLQYLWENIAKALNANTSGKPIPEDVKHFFPQTCIHLSLCFKLMKSFRKNCSRCCEKNFKNTPILKWISTVQNIRFPPLKDYLLFGLNKTRIFLLNNF